MEHSRYTHIHCTLVKTQTKENKQLKLWPTSCLVTRQSIPVFPSWSGAGSLLIMAPPASLLNQVLGHVSQDAVYPLGEAYVKCEDGHHDHTATPHPAGQEQVGEHNHQKQVEGDSTQ